MHSNSRRDLVVSIVKGNPTPKDVSNQFGHIFGLVRCTQAPMSHHSSRCKRNLPILNMKPRVRKERIVSHMIIVEVGDDYIRHGSWIDTKCLKSITGAA